MTWNQASNRFGWGSYLGQAPGLASAPGYAVPARREDLSGLPPAWIGVGAVDLFLAEDIAYAQNLRRAGVDCELVIVPGAFHAFDRVAPESKLAQDFRASQIAALQRHL